MLILYLAISKTVYWLNAIAELSQSEFDGVGRALLVRILNRDLLIILGLILFFFLEKAIDWKETKHGGILQHIMFYSIGYVMLFALYLAYIWVLNLVFADPVDWSTFNWSTTIAFSLIMYVAIMCVATIKQTKLDKANKKAETDKLAMLEALANDGILTPEELEQKKEKLHIML